MSAQSNIRVAIVGGGIGGLFAANVLVAHGFRVSVHEQATALGEVGAGLILTPNSLRHLRRMGLGSEIERLGARICAGSGYFRHDGAPIGPYLLGESRDLELFGIHRADLIEILAADCRKASCTWDAAARASIKMSKRRPCDLAMDIRRRRMSSSRPTAFTPRSVMSWLLPRNRCFRDRTCIADWCRANAFRIGRQVHG